MDGRISGDFNFLSGSGATERNFTLRRSDSTFLLVCSIVKTRLNAGSNMTVDDVEEISINSIANIAKRVMQS
jgi:hypothetical protein